MDNKYFCQSCSMPIDNPELQGSEKDGSKTKDYCVYCYQNGVFTSPHITLNEMTKLVKQQMEKRNIGSSIINMAISSLPKLKRWSNIKADS